VLLAANVSAEIAAIRGVAIGEDRLSPASQSAFSTPIEMMRFIARLRELCGGKPVGLKLCIGHPWKFLGLCKVMVESGIYRDFLVVDGKEGGAGAAPLEFTDQLGMPLRKGLVFARDALVGIGARDRIASAAPARSSTRSTWRSRSGRTGAIRRAGSRLRGAIQSLS
jgi:glutamate synthase domain-containing protein 2